MVKSIGKVELVFIAIRLLSVYFVQTWYVPDEYWQSLEVAHRMTFGYGYLTWEWIQGIRNVLYPFLISLLYTIVKWINIDYVNVLVLLPRICQALLSAYADCCFYRWCGRRKWAAFNIAVSWYWFYMGSRTIINTVENALTTIALSKYPFFNKKHHSNSNSDFLWPVALTCIMRPTAIIPWLSLIIFHLKRSELKHYLSIGCVALIFGILFDSFWYGRFVISSWQFVRFNVFENLGTWYGTEPWHWYLTMGLPSVLGIQILPFLMGAYKTILRPNIHPTNFLLLTSIVSTVFIYSLISHKEFRFILPILPMALYIASDFLTRWSRKANKTVLWLSACILFSSNVIPAWYLGMVHQRGTLDIMTPLAQIANKHNSEMSILFLMPCHSTPLYSHLHVNVTTKFLNCDPPVRVPRGVYKDEADRFYENPSLWLHTNYPSFNNSITALPSHVVMFDILVPQISHFLIQYKPVHKFFHTNVPISNRIGNSVVIYERRTKN